MSPGQHYSLPRSHSHTHTQTNRVKTTPAALSQLITRPIHEGANRKNKLQPQRSRWRFVKTAFSLVSSTDAGVWLQRTQLKGGGSHWVGLSPPHYCPQCKHYTNCTITLPHFLTRGAAKWHSALLFCDSMKRFPLWDGNKDAGGVWLTVKKWDVFICSFKHGSDSQPSAFKVTLPDTLYSTVIIIDQEGIVSYTDRSWWMCDVTAARCMEIIIPSFICLSSDIRVYF